MVRQAVLEKKNSEFKFSLLRLKIDIVSHPDHVVAKAPVYVN